MNHEHLIVGAGIGGLSAAIALGLNQIQTKIIEKRETHAEYGAGIQLAPNAMRRLQKWGLNDEIQQLAAKPKSIDVHSWFDSELLASMPLDKAFRTRFGFEYCTIHRADLHELLLKRLLHIGTSDILMNTKLQVLKADEFSSLERQGVTIDGPSGVTALEVPSVLGCDGVFSTVKQLVWPQCQVRPSGQIAYRAMIPQDSIPLHLRCESIKVWMGPGVHWVQYPIRGMQSLNVVVLIEQSPAGVNFADAADQWQMQRHMHDIAHDFSLGLQTAHATVREMFDCIQHWGAWQLWTGDVLSGPHEMAHQRVALLGDAAHPMLPYVAQAGAMAIEDAQSMADAMGLKSHTVDQQLQHYAQVRWKRNAQVQARALRQAKIFHATPPLSHLRDWALRLSGKRLMQLSWIYQG